MEKILTVVVPTYNMEKYLDRCLSSLIVEDSLMDVLEVIVVNDGSKDRSSEIAHSYGAKYPQTFIVVDKENGNYGSCVNKGIDLATGKYFRILDADDWFDNTGLKRFLQSLAEIDSDVVVTKFTSFCDDGSNHINGFGDNRKLNFLYDLSDPAIDFQPDIWQRMHQVTYRLGLLKSSALMLQTGISYTDTEYVYFPMKSAATILFLDVVLYQYCYSRDGQTMSLSSRKKSIGDMYRVAMRLLTDYVSQGNSTNKALQVSPLKSILELLYLTVLEDCPFSMKNNSYLLKVERVLKRDEYLKRFTGGLTVRDFHYVSFWRRWGFSRNSAPYRFYMRIKRSAQI